MPAISNSTSMLETWLLSFSFAASQAVSTASYGSVSRYAGSVTIATTSTPFYLPSGQQAQIVDLYINTTATQDAVIDFQINEISQRLNLLLSVRNATIAGRKGLPRQIALPAGASFRPLAFPTAAIGTAAVTQTCYLDAYVG